MFYFDLMVQFLYKSLALTTVGVGIVEVNKLRNKPKKLANNKIESHKALKKVKGDNGLSVSKNVRLNDKADFEGVCLVGPTGSHKTTTLFLNNLLEENIKGSIIVTDPKGELFKLTSGYQKEVCNRKVYKLDLSNTNNSEKYNLLEQCRNTEEVLELASSLLINGALSIELATGKKAGGIEWIQMSESLLSSVFLYVKELNNPFNTIEFALSLLITLKNNQLKKLIEGSNNIDAINQYNIFLQVGESERTEGSIKITLSSNMKLFADRNINRISEYTSFNIEDFRKEPSVLYIIYPERKSNYFAPFIAPFFSQIINKLLEHFNEDSEDIHFLFDEFPNVGMISNMSVNAATVRSRRISLSICLQSISQLYQTYGINNSKSILNNLKTKVILPGISDIETINLISALAGTEEITVKNKSVSSGKESYSIGKAKRRIFEEGELRTLEDKTALIINSNNMPIIDRLEPYYENDNINNVKEEIAYKGAKNTIYDIRKEIEKLKESTVEKEVVLDEEFQTTRDGGKAAAIARKIFAR